MKEGVIVTVLPGETLDSIAQWFSVDKQDIIKYNEGLTFAKRDFSNGVVIVGDVFRVNSYTRNDQNLHSFGPEGQRRRDEYEKLVLSRIAADEQRQAQDAGSTNSPGCVVGQPNCIKEYVDIMHVNHHR